MPSFLNEVENEGLVVIGRVIEPETFDSPEPIKALVATIEAEAAKHSLPLGLVYCGTTINWPDDVEFTSIVIGLVTFSGAGDDDVPLAGEVGPKAMDVSRGDAIPESFWSALEEKHNVKLEGPTEVYLAVAGWTWASLGDDEVCASADHDGFTVIPEELRSEKQPMLVGYC